VSLFGKSQRDAGTSDGLGARPLSAPRSAEEARNEPVAQQQQPQPQRRPEPGGDTVANIGKSISIKGDLSGNEDLQIDGNVEGRIDLPSNQLTIGEDGKVKADIHAKAVIVVGHVTGNVSATERIQVEASGIVDGDVRAPRLVVQEGAVLNGAVEMGEVSKPATGAPRTSSSTSGSTGSPDTPKVAAGGGSAA